MRCIIVRHGKAEASSESGRDEDRRLKQRGIRQAEFLASSFASAGARPTLILASRFERTIATAHIIQKATGSPLHVAPELESGRAPSQAAELILAHANQPALMLVGHNPQLSELIWLLTRGAPAEESGLRTGEAVILEATPPEVIGTSHEIERIRLDGED